MPRQAVKCVVEVDMHIATCPYTFLRDHGYVYIRLEMLGLEARTKSLPPTFPLLFKDRLRFRWTFFDHSDSRVIASMLKGEDLVIELRQHVDYKRGGEVIAHCTTNTHEFLYPTAPPSCYGYRRVISLHKTSKFKPIRGTRESVQLEFSTKTTVIKEVPRYQLSPRVSAVDADASVEAIPAGRYPLSWENRIPSYYNHPPLDHHVYDADGIDGWNYGYAMDDLDLLRPRSHRNRRSRYRSMSLPRALGRSFSSLHLDRFNDSDVESDTEYDMLRESLREERNALNEAMKLAEQEAYYRYLHKTH